MRAVFPRAARASATTTAAAASALAQSWAIDRRELDRLLAQIGAGGEELLPQKGGSRRRRRKTGAA